jgi:translation initiation factor 2 subunit 3
MYAIPGGLIGMGLKVDPFITRSDSLVGQIIGLPNQMPDVLSEIDVSYYLMKRLLGVKSSGQDQKKIQPLKPDELLMINVGSQSLAGKVINVKKESVRIEFSKPVCANIGDKIALSRRVDNNFRLIGWGEIKKCFKQQSLQKR